MTLYGVSDAPAWWVARANTLAEWRDWSFSLGLKIQINLIERTSERELIPMADALDLAICAWSSLAWGALTGRFRTAATEGASRYDVMSGLSDPLKVNTDRSGRIIYALLEVARKTDREPNQIALNWQRQRMLKVALIPIIGARSVSQLDENLAILDFELDAESLNSLTKASEIELGFPHDFAAGARDRDLADMLTPHSAVMA